MKGISINAKAISEEKNKGCATVFLVAFGSIFLVIGMGAVWALLISPLMQWQAAKAWPVVEGEILESRIETHHGEDSTTYSAEFEYAYEVAGQKYDNNRYGIVQVNGSRSSATKLKRKHPVGSKVPIFYNPSDPGDSLMDRDIGWGILLGLIPIVFVLFGGFVVWGATIQGWGKRDSKLGSKAYRSTTSQSGGSSSLATSYLADGQSADDRLDQEFSGPLKLKPEWSRMAVFLMASAGCVFWNGIVSIFVKGVVTDGFPIFPTLILIPFLLVGIGLIVACFYTFLALFNPKIEIAMSNGAVPIGSEVDIAWEVKGNAKRFRKLTITIEGEELATYRQGTNTRTESKTFSDMLVTDTNSLEKIRFGTAAVTIPKDTIHSFKSPRNEIKWSINIKGDIPLWPDVNEKLVFRVIPVKSQSESA